jgi:hypothetical protein
MACVLALTAFAVAECAPRRQSAAGGILQRVTAGLLVAGAALIYQSNSLFYLVFLAGGWALKIRGPWKMFFDWFVRHCAVLAGGLVLAFAIAKTLFATGVFPESARVAFDPNLFGKVVWFYRNSLPNALALFVIDDFRDSTEPWFSIVASGTALLLASGAVFYWRRHGRVAAGLWCLGVIALSLGAYSISIIASERWASYRTIFPLAVVTLVFCAVVLNLIGDLLRGLVSQWFRGAIAVGLIVAALMARHSAQTLLADPQREELRAIEVAAQNLDLSRDRSIYFITPSPGQTFAPLLYADEFGSLSSDSDWTPKEMVKLVLHALHPAEDETIKRLVVTSRPYPPKIVTEARVFDLRVHGDKWAQ